MDIDKEAKVMEVVSSLGTVGEVQQAVKLLGARLKDLTGDVLKKLPKVKYTTRVRVKGVPGEPFLAYVGSETVVLTDDKGHFTPKLPAEHVTHIKVGDGEWEAV